QSQLEVGTAAPGEVLCSPLDVQDAVGSSATDRSENPKARVYRIQVVPVWKDRVVVLGPRQANIGKRRIRGRELGIAVGRQIDGGEGLAVQGGREGQRKCGDAVVAMIADIRRARHNASAYLNYRKTCAGYRCWSRRGRRRRGWTGCRCWGWRR